MAKKQTPAPGPQPANLSAQEIEAAIPKLERRVSELKEVERILRDLREAGFGDPEPGFLGKLDALERKLDSTLVEIFGADTLDYKRHVVHGFLEPVSMGMGEEISNRKMAGYYEEGLLVVIPRVEAVVEVLREKLEDMDETPGSQALQAYEGLELHPEIALAASDLYRDRHYANAIGDAVKALNNLVRLRSGVEDREGSTLMENVFGSSEPVLRFNEMADQSDRDEQKGFMMMFSGAVAGLRNPRAHKFIQDDPERALEFIAFVSLLAKLLDGAEKAPPQ